MIKDPTSQDIPLYCQNLSLWCIILLAKNPSFVGDGWCSFSCFLSSLSKMHALWPLDHHPSSIITAPSTTTMVPPLHSGKFFHNLLQKFTTNHHVYFFKAPPTTICSLLPCLSYRKCLSPTESSLGTKMTGFWENT